MSSQSFRIYSLLIVLIFVWALTWPLTKIGLMSMSPLWFVVCRIAIATVAMFAVVAISKNLIFPTRKDLPLVLNIGFFQIALFLLLINLGIEHMPVGHAALLTYTTPLWVMPISVWLFGERLTGLKVLGVILGLLGLLILFNPWQFNWHSPGLVLGTVEMLGAAFSWAVAMLCARYSYWHHTPFQLIPWQLLLALVLLVCCAVVLQPDPHILWQPGLIVNIGYIGLIGTAFGYWASIKLSKELPIMITSLSYLAIPGVAIFFSYLILHEIITLTMLLAFLLIIAGIVCMLMGNWRLSKQK